jgi:membrane-bound metal-dependent hydrolase YbcI (DUF457 family)
MALPPAHLLVGLGCAEMVCTALPLPRRKAWVVAGAAAILPDADFVLVYVRSASIYHGTFTHSIVAAALVGLLVWMVAGGGWAAVASAGYGSHLLVDLLDSHGPTNVLLGWPFTLRHSHAITRIFPSVPYLKGHGVRYAALSLFEPPSLPLLLLQTLVGATIFLALFLAAAAIRRGLGYAIKQGVPASS